jgi:hypothetical protein
MVRLNAPFGEGTIRDRFDDQDSSLPLSLCFETKVPSRLVPLKFVLVKTISVTRATPHTLALYRVLA